jgi:hypothetical protein
VRIRCADHATPSTRKSLALTSPTSGGRSAGIVRLRAKKPRSLVVVVVLVVLLVVVAVVSVLVVVIVLVVVVVASCQSRLDVGDHSLTHVAHVTPAS